MKNYFKKFSMVFLILLAVIGVGAIQNGTVANAATVGQQLTSPESGWRRYDSNESDILYIGSGWNKYNTTNPVYGGSVMQTSTLTDKSIIKFYGSKFRLIGIVSTQSYCFKGNIKIDGIPVDSFTQRSSYVTYKALNFEELNLDLGFHTVEISFSDGVLCIDAIDIDDNGYLVDPNSQLSSILLDKSSIDLEIGNSEQLVATTIPAGTQVIWVSSDPSVATVDTTGKVTAVSEGQATITATTTDGSNLSATCTVSVTNPITPGITLNKTSDSLIIGDTDILMATTTSLNANVTWSSSNTSIATVDSNGKITAVGEGTAIITATITDGSNLSASCTVNVTKETEPTNPTEAEYIVNTARAKGDNTNNASGEVSIIFKGIAEAQLSVVKTADVDSVYVGDNFTYTIVVTNTSNKLAKAVIINDAAPNHIDFIVNGVTTTQGKVDPSSTSKNIVVNVGDIAPLGTVTIKVPATVFL